MVLFYSYKDKITHLYYKKKTNKLYTGFQQQKIKRLNSKKNITIIALFHY